MQMQITWVLSAVVMLLVAGCTAAAAVDDPSRPSDPVAPASQALGGAGEPTRSDNHQVDSQAQRIEELEARLDALQWTEQDAIAMVKAQLRERLKGRLTADWIEAAILRGRTKPLLERGRWTAIHRPESHRWLVLVITEGGISDTFHAYEKTGLVEVVPQSELSLADRIHARRFLEAENPPTTDK